MRKTFCTLFVSSLREILGTNMDVGLRLDKVVNLMPGCVIIDSRNVYDKLSNKVCVKAMKRTGLELLTLKGSELTKKVHGGRAHSEAQLANSLNKAKEIKQLNLYCVLHEFSTQAEAARPRYSP